MERHTRQRAAIRAVIEQAHRPLSIEEIFTAAGRALPGLGVATVYRAVKNLLAEQVVRAVQLPASHVRYELAHLEHHHHFHCRHCDRVYEVHGCPGHLTRMTPRGFTMEAHDLTIIGRCATCNQQKDA